MFIKKSIYNYNAYELLLATSRLAFVLDAWGALILILELIIILLLVEKENATKDISAHCYTSICSTNNYDTIPHHS
jgi:hypothetical protein